METKRFKSGLITILMMIAISSRAEIITAIADKGTWNKSSTWDLDRLPVCGDTVYIPGGIDVIIHEHINFERHGVSGLSVQLIVSGTLSFESGKNLNLSENSAIKVNAKGEIREKKLSRRLHSFISIHMIKVWSSKNGDIAGPAFFGERTASPQELTDFEITPCSDTFVISWKIRQLEEAGYYELFVSKDGKRWESIKRMKALHSDSTEKMLCHIYKASKKDRSLYFKLNSCDLNGKSTVLASAKSTRKADYSEPFSLIPGMLISSSFIILSDLIHLKL